MLHIVCARTSKDQIYVPRYLSANSENQEIGIEAVAVMIRGMPHLAELKLSDV